MKAIYFDLDGTLNRFYEVDNWLEKLHTEDISPYVEALPIINFEELREVLDDFIATGVTIGVISWSAMGGSKEYNRRTRKAKIEWCEKYFPNVFTEYHVIKYGTPKHHVRKIKDSILVDDNADVRQTWKGDTVDATKDVVFALKEILERLEN